MPFPQFPPDLGELPVDGLQLRNHNLTVTDAAEVKWVIPDQVQALVIRPVGGAVSLSTVSTGDAFTIADGEAFPINSPAIGQHPLFFTTTAESITVQIIYWLGIPG